ncbi:hypothetical protein SAMN04488029_2364 [Reichenbachiella faecimaris]|uniref:Uncharacterized protein n=1 Tax=Reichenbachiella faecimaris TaxID=692418 RepID=A0A1W2GES5_REIFA|nr:hypothetical protein [Reichenbachiella faecimaris]SMD35147.1 hypothetical protein SAMN04488029_2364 [Reichenbachiella faecimaris]
MKRTFLLSLLFIFQLGFLHTIEAQRKLKYEDLLPGILQDEPGVGVANLENLIETDPENPSMYLQLGLIYNRRFQESDPITGYKKAMANISLAKAAFENCERFITEKEVKKNKEEYINFAIYDDKGKFTVSLDSISKAILMARQDMEAFEINMPGIYDDFTRSYTHYSKANQIFTKIISRHASIKDLYLLYDDKMSEEFEQIKSNYNESLKYFSAYKEKTNGYDIGYYQEIKIDPINIYKLDGLAVEINFLKQQQIPIWNYAKWVDDTKAYIDQNITALRTMMVENQKIISAKINQVEEDVLNGKIEPIEVDKEFLFTLRKYDLISVVEPLFLYNEKKHELLIQEQLNKVSTETMKISPERQISHYGYLLSSIRKSDTLLQHVETRNTDFSYQKYKGFIDNYYLGTAGLQKMISTEKTTNQKQFADYLADTRQLLQLKYTSDSIQSTVKYRRISIPNYISRPNLDALQPAERITMHKTTNLDGSAYLGGIYLDDKSSLITAYVCRVEPNHSVRWYKDFSLQMDSIKADSHTILAAMVGGQAGCTFVLNGTHMESGAKINTLFAYSEEGSQMMVRNLTIDEFPRIIEFEEQTNTFLIGFNGRDLAKDLTQSNQIVLANYNVIGDLLWKYEKEIVGDLVGVVALEDGYLITGNYSRIQDSSGKFVRVEDGYASYLIKMNNTGQWSNERFLNTTTPYRTTHFLKSGEHSIHVLGSTDLSQENFETKSDQLVHFVVNRNLDIVSSPLQ